MATLAQYAQALPNGIVNIMGGGLTVIPPKLPVVFIAGSVQFDWGAIGTPHAIRVDLLDEHGDAVPGQNGDPVVVTGQANVAPAPGLPFGAPLALPLAIPVGPLELEPQARHEFKLTLDDESHEDWTLGFITAPEAQSKAA